ncbi:MAG TPA: DNA translocase FtsK [Dehalococcoidia bacterium]|nr:DNA translocase FtsK [Dehalococcoidia bacterium]
MGGAVLGLILVFAFLGPLVNLAEAILRVFGFGIVIIITAAVVDGLVLSRRPQITGTFVRIFVGAHALALTLFGILGALTPGWSIGDAHFAEVSLGGRFGHVFTSSPFGIVALVANTGAGLSLLSPTRARQVLNGIGAGLKWLNSLRLPQRAWDGFRSFFAGLVPREADEYEERMIEQPYVPELDEEWQESDAVAVEDEADELIEEEPKNSGHKKKADEMLITADLEDEEKGYQHELPMGRPTGRGWELPPLDNLAEAAPQDLRPVDNEERARLIIETLASFGVDARVVSINQGPTVTQFGVEPGWDVKTKTVAIRDETGKSAMDKDGRPVTRTEVTSKTRVRVNKVTNLANDLALALAAPTIRIEAPVPGKPIIGIEVPNHTSEIVPIRSVIESTAFAKANAKTGLAIALGKGVSGEPVAADLANMPHLLIAGSTGSGKSVCINGIIACFLLHNTPEQLRLVLVDPKRVELTTYESVPHLAFSKVITDVEEVPGVLQAVIHEMDSRYRRFAEVGVRNLEAYNKSPKASHRLPNWVVIIDELADLMMAAPYEVERQICRLAQLARATGIHLIIATQRPSVDVVTGLIKANFPTRIAFSVSSQVDSRTIIDTAGADKLLGRGDMLFMPTDAAKPSRIQGSFVSDQEIEKIVGWWDNDRFRHLVPDKLDHLLESEDEDGEGAKAEADDPLFDAARELAIQHSRISTSLLQRRLHIGYPRAARLIDILEEQGVISEAAAGQSREVLISVDDRYVDDSKNGPVTVRRTTVQKDEEDEDEEEVLDEDYDTPPFDEDYGRESDEDGEEDDDEDPYA